MGVDGLVKALEGAREKEYPFERMAGKRVGIDISIWIYQCMRPGDSRDGRQSIFQRLMVLLHHKVIPILVFDGEDLPAKQDLLNQRKTKKDKKKIAAENLMKQGKLVEAREMLKCTGERTADVMDSIKKFCETRGIDYFQAPYEADAQLAYLMKTKAIDIVITEDADLMIYGCDKVLYKFNRNGYGQMYEQSRLEGYWGGAYDAECFQAVSVLVGCDYLTGGLLNFGIVSAIELYPKLARPFNFENMVSLVKQEVEEGFEEKFMVAMNTFKHQLVFDPASKEVVPLNPYPDGKTAEDFPYAGNPNLAQGYYYEAKIQPRVDSVESFAPDKFYCANCTEEFKSSEEVTDHRYVFHRLQCPLCPKSFTINYDFNYHMERHEGRRDHVCDLCDKGFLTLRDLNAHTKAAHPDSLYACLTCGKAYKTKGNLDGHTLIHVNERPYMCEFCGDRFNDPGTLKKHLTTHTDERPFKCTFPNCSQAFKHKNILTQHMVAHSDSRTFICPTCKKDFKTKPNLDAHMSTHAENRSFQCPHCEKAFKAQQILTNHLRIHSTERPYKCSLCGKAFKQLQPLQAHMNTHNEKKLFKCATCQKDFKSKMHLRSHQTSHLQERSFVCNTTCSKAFKTKGSLTSHQKVHSEEKPHVCPNCATGFKRRSEVVRHLLTCKA